MTISVPVKIDSLSIQTDVQDNVENFNPLIVQKYTKGKRFRQADGIYENTIETLNVLDYDAGATYSVDDVVFGDPYSIGTNMLHTAISTGGKRNLDPEDYVYTDSIAFDTSLDFNQWTKRYVKLATGFTNDKITLTLGNVTWEIYNQNNGKCSARITYDINKFLVIEDINIGYRISNKEVEDIAEIFYPYAPSTTNSFFIPKSLIIGSNGIYMRTNVDAAVQTESAPDIDFLPVLAITDLKGFRFIEKSNSKKPFDGKNYSVAKSNGSMKYVVKSLDNFNSIALSGVIADSITISVKNSSNSTVYTFQRDINANRDIDGILSPYPVTEIFYAINTDVPSYDTTYSIEIKLLGEFIELGNIFLAQAVDAGFTNLQITNTYKDYSVLEYDVWGNSDYVERAKISIYKATVDIHIDDYDMTDRLMKSLGKKVVVIDGADNTDDLKPTVFSSTQKVGRITSYSQKSIVKNNNLGEYATYSITIEEIV